MLKRNVIFLFAFAVIASSINAQVRPGVKLGYNFGGVTANYLGDGLADKLEAGAPGNFKNRSGFQVGMIADCPINNAFAIQPGVRSAMQGFTDEYESTHKVIRNFSLFYLQVPVYFQYRLNIAEEANLLFQAGPYAGLGLFGRQSLYRKGVLQELRDGCKKINFSEDFNSAFDYGISAGVGIEFFRFQLVVAYDLGLNKAIFKKNNGTGYSYNVDMRNNNFSVTLGFVFGRRDPLQNLRD